MPGFILRYEQRIAPKEAGFQAFFAGCSERLLACESVRKSAPRHEVQTGARELAETHREIKSADVLGQCAYGNVIDAGFSEFTNGVECDVAGDFQRCLAIGEFDCLAHHIGSEVIEHNNVGTGFQRFIQLFKVFNFDFYRNIRVQPERFFYCLPYRAGGDNMVLFNQKGIGETQTMVGAAAAKNGIF